MLSSLNILILIVYPWFRRGIANKTEPGYWSQTQIITEPWELREHDNTQPLQSVTGSELYPVEENEGAVSSSVKSKPFSGNDLIYPSGSPVVSEDPFKGLAFSPGSSPRTRPRWCKHLAAPFGRSLHPNSWCLPGATPRCVYRTGAPPNPPVTNREKKRARRSVQTSHLKYRAPGVISPEILSWPFNKLQRSRLPVLHTSLSTSDFRVREKQTHCVLCSLAEDCFSKNAPNRGLPWWPSD